MQVLLSNSFFFLEQENSMILEAYNEQLLYQEWGSEHICKCRPFPFLNVNYVYKSNRVVQKAKNLRTKVLKPQRYKNIRVLDFCMLLHDLLHHKGCFCLTVAAQGYLTLEDQLSWNSKTPFSRKLATSKQTGTVEGRKPSLWLLPVGTAHGLGAPKCWGLPLTAFSGNTTVTHFQRGMWSFGGYKSKFEPQNASQISTEVPVLGPINVLKALFPSEGKGNYKL